MKRRNVTCYPIDELQEKYSRERNIAAKVATHSRETYCPPARNQRTFEYFLSTIPILHKNSLIFFKLNIYLLIHNVC